MNLDLKVISPDDFSPNTHTHYLDLYKHLYYVICLIMWLSVYFSSLSAFGEIQIFNPMLQCRKIKKYVTKTKA